MPYLIGVGLALAVCAFGSVVGLDRDRAFYATMTIVVASYYALFATMAGGGALRSESAAILLFVIASVLGFKRNMWVVVGALCGHGLLDSVHGHLIANPGVPEWWPGFCLSFDITAGCYLGLLLARSPSTARPSPDAAR